MSRERQVCIRGILLAAACIYRERRDTLSSSRHRLPRQPVTRHRGRERCVRTEIRSHSASGSPQTEESTPMLPESSRPGILLVDDEPDMLKLIPVCLRAENLQVDLARSGHEALERLAQYSYPLLITDLMMPRMSGLELLERVQQSYPEMAVIILTAHGSIQLAVEAVKKGATDFLTKPLRADELLLRVRNALRQGQLRREVQDLRNQIERSRQPELIIGESAAIHSVHQQVARVAARDVSVLIYGESGTGKELGRKSCCATSCSATRRGPSRVLTPRRRGCSRRPRAGRCSWTRSARSRRRCRCSCCASCSSGSSRGWAGRRRSGPTCACCRRRTATCSAP
jgi:DNA-binding response OmpR family regulator